MTQTYRPTQVFPDSAERRLRAMLAALDDALAALADAREELRGLYTGPRTYPEELELFLAAEADNQDITTHLAAAARDIRAALAILHTTTTAAASNASPLLHPHAHKEKAAADVEAANKRPAGVGERNSGRVIRSRGTRPTYLDCVEGTSDE